MIYYVSACYLQTTTCYYTRQISDPVCYKAAFESRKNTTMSAAIFTQQSVSVTSWARQTCVAKVSDTSEANLFLIFTGKKPTNKLAPS